MTAQATFKLCRDISDEVCRYCPQYWTDECGAYLVTITRGKKVNRLVDKSAVAYQPLKPAAAAYQLPLWA